MTLLTVHELVSILTAMEYLTNAELEELDILLRLRGISLDDIEDKAPT